MTIAVTCRKVSESPRAHVEIKLSLKDIESRIDDLNEHHGQWVGGRHNLCTIDPDLVALATLAV
jgi:hypothetical protein